MKNKILPEACCFLGFSKASDAHSCLEPCDSWWMMGKDVCRSRQLWPVKQRDLWKEIRCREPRSSLLTSNSQGRGPKSKRLTSPSVPLGSLIFRVNILKMKRRRRKKTNTFLSHTKIIGYRPTNRLKRDILSQPLDLERFFSWDRNCLKALRQKRRQQTKAKLMLWSALVRRDGP